MKRPERKCVEVNCSGAEKVGGCGAAVVVVVVAAAVVAAAAVVVVAAATESHLCSDVSEELREGTEAQIP